jgi:hypothetical protein
MINTNHPKYTSLTPEVKEAIHKLHLLRDNLALIAQECKSTAKTVYPVYIAIETALQELWRFPKNRNYIKDWYFPHCTCPKIDNDDRYPDGAYYRSADCPIHGYGNLNG